MPLLSSLVAVTLLSSGLAVPTKGPGPNDPATPDGQVARGGSYNTDDYEDADDADDASIWAPLSYYTSFGLDEDLHPEVEDEVLVMWIMAAILPLGEFYLPYVFGDPGDGYFGDMLTAYAVHGYGYMPSALGVVPCLIPLAWLWALAYTWGAKLYLNPVSMLNLYSRSLYRQEQNAPHPLTDGGLPALRLPSQAPTQTPDTPAATPLPATERAVPPRTPIERPAEDVQPAPEKPPAEDTAPASPAPAAPPTGSPTAFLY